MAFSSLTTTSRSQIGTYIARRLGLSLAPTTARLNADLDSWFKYETTSTKPKGGQQRRRAAQRGIDARGLEHFHGGGCGH